MFTGIIEQVGHVSEVSPHETGCRLALTGRALGELSVGASIAVNGVCLTVVGTSDQGIAVDVVPETLSRTNLGDLVPGSPVNLERPMAVDGRFDGHIVQGHVDGVGVIGSVDDQDGGVVMTVSPPGSLMRFIAHKGSITVDGVSLTVADLTSDSFSVALIPHTLEVTTLGSRSAGDTVNLETDVLAKYVDRLLEVGQ